VKHKTGARAFAAFVALVGPTGATLAASAQTPPPAGLLQTAPWARMPVNDAEFVRSLELANTLELDQGKYIVNRTQDPGVHQFAQRMIDEHSIVALKLEAATRDTNLPPAPRDDGRESALGKRLMAILQGETVAQLDTDYMRMQVPLHRRALALLTWESQSGANTNIKFLAAGLIPNVQQHLQLALDNLAVRNLTPYMPPDVQQIPGNPNPTGSAAPLPSPSASHQP